MPRLKVNGVDLYYEQHGTGPQTIVFAHGLLWSSRMFDPQITVLKERYRCIAFDHRGQGQSEITRTGYDMDNLADDAVALIRSLNAFPCHLLGLSMGGFVAMRVASRHPDLVRSLMLVDTSPDAELPENIPGYRRLAFVARWLGMRRVADRIMPIMFGPKFLTDPARQAERDKWRQVLLANNVVALKRSTEGVVTRRSVYDEIGRIRVPTLVLVGDRDVATAPALSERIRQRIPNARLVTVPDSGHSSTIEEPAAVTAALIEFLGGHA